MKTQICDVWEGPFKHRGVFEKHLRKCNRIAKYYSPGNYTFYCKMHLKKALKFYENPVDIESGKKVDRHILYKFGRIEFVKEGFEAKKEIAEPREVISSKYIKERKTGAWKAQINELEDGKYLVEVYWDAYLFEVTKDDYYYKIFENEREAQKLYDDLTFNNMRKLLVKENSK